MLTKYTPITGDEARDIERVARGLRPLDPAERSRYGLHWTVVQFERFRKSPVELMKYRGDIRKILTDNTIKDIRDAEDKRFFDIVAAAAREQWGGLYPMTPYDNLVAGFPMRGYPIDTRGLR